MQKQYEIDIYGLAYGGSGIGKFDGKICFIDGALPGERVRFRKLNEKKRFLSGFVTDILTNSPDRVKPPCPYYNECGGCQYQHLNYEKEIYYKAQQVKETLFRIGGLEGYHFSGLIPSESEYNYRSSVTLHKSEKGYGYFAKDNKSIIAIDQCPLAVPPINKLIDKLPALSAKKDITIKCDGIGNTWISNLPGNRFFKDEFLSTKLTFSPLAFSQSNSYIASRMVNYLRDLMQKEKRQVLFDLYCGVGFFGVLLRSMFESVIGVDDSSIAIDCALAAKKDLLATNIKFYCADAEKKFVMSYETLKGSTNTILLDPPRSGITQEMALRLVELKTADSLYYVSCDPATLARDAKILTQNKAWTLESIACFDMFARTKHIESIALFKR